MYPPPYYTDPDPAFARRVMEENSFALLVVDGLNATHLPLVLNDAGEVEGHVARSNPIAHAMGREALAVFSGPHGYVSATLYDDPGRQVPTWNYASVQLRGRLEALSDDDVVPHLARVAASYEGEGGWSVDAAPDYVARLVGGIRAFRIREAELRAFRKMSANKTPAIRKRIIDAARAAGDTAFAREMGRALDGES